MLSSPSSPPKMKGCAGRLHAQEVLFQSCLPNLHQQPLSELDRLSVGLKAAQKTYKQAVLCGHDEGPFLVADNVSARTFEQWCVNLETRWNLCFIHHQNQRGCVLLYGDPTKLHEAVASWVNDEFVLQAGRQWRELVLPMGHAGQPLASGIKEPDGSYTSASARPPCMPRFTLEVAYRNEDVIKLTQEISDWHAAGVILSVGIKVLVKEVGKGNDKHVEIGLYWIQQTLWDKKPEIIDFSLGACTQENRGKFVIGFPFSYITADVPCTDDFLISIDLFTLQQYITKLLILEAEGNQKVMYVDSSGLFKYDEIAACKVCRSLDRKKVRCGHPDCKGWFHLSCVGLDDDDAKLPSLWFCPSCLKRSESVSKWKKFKAAR